jgi:hypothetical protein
VNTLQESKDAHTRVPHRLDPLCHSEFTAFWEQAYPSNIVKGSLSPMFNLLYGDSRFDNLKCLAKDRQDLISNQ